MKMRIYHRYLGFFLAGIMAVYAISGIILIFRNTDFLKQETIVEKQIPTATPLNEIGTALKVRNFKIEKQEGNLIYFKNGVYDQSTGKAEITTKSLPYVLDKMSKMHKANSSSPLFFLNIFFGISLLFFVLSAFWMYMPGSSVFKKGMYFVLAGLVFALVVIFV
ncbi:MAG: hypothetical protein R8G66_01065 [Cytophagales bacterium]|nr:hypothetical protein [Cytophagales bacterium]